jgi:hypothetical protein
MPCGARLEVGWIPVRHTVRKDDEVHAADHLDIQLRLLPILEREQQDEIVRDELARRDWERQPDGTMTKQLDDVIAVLPAGGDTIRISVEDRTAVSATGSAAGTVREEDLAAQQAIADRAGAAATASLARAREDARADLVRRNIDRLLRVERDIRAEVAQIASATTRRSLERRAAELGAIESVTEGQAKDGSYELTIRVKT